MTGKKATEKSKPKSETSACATDTQNKEEKPKRKCCRKK